MACHSQDYYRVIKSNETNLYIWAKTASAADKWENQVQEGRCSFSPLVLLKQYTCVCSFVLLYSCMWCSCGQIYRKLTAVTAGEGECGLSGRGLCSRLMVSEFSFTMCICLHVKTVLWVREIIWSQPKEWKHAHFIWFPCTRYQCVLFWARTQETLSQPPPCCLALPQLTLRN